MADKALVKDYMTRKVICVTPETPTSELVELMKKPSTMVFLLQMTANLWEWLHLLI